jgi:putative oxidoreductase
MGGDEAPPPGRRAMSMIAAALGRILLALLFVISGVQKVFDPSGAAQALAGAGLPSNWALATGIFELVAGLLLAIGLMSRIVSILLFGFVALTIFFFHNQVTDPVQGAAALKNLAVMGGLLMVFAYGQMRWSYDHWRARDKVRKAELRAARAEGKAEGVTEVAHTTTVVKD